MISTLRSPVSRISNLYDARRRTTHRILRNALHESHSPHQPLMSTHPLRQPILHISLPHLFLLPWLQHDIGARVLFSGESHADHARVGDGGVLEEESFEFCRGDLVAADFDEFFHAVDDVETPGLVDGGDVAGAHPAAGAGSDGVS